MSDAPVQRDYVIGGHDAASVAGSIEHGVTTGALRPHEPVPSVRGLARRLGLSPTTVAAAYRELRRRGVLVSHDRSRTVVAHRPPLAVRLAPEFPEGTVDLTDGSPDPALLPDLAAALMAVAPTQRLYGEEAALPRLLELAKRSFIEDGIAADHLAIVGGALDGIERILELHCRVGDAIAVEDPGYAASLDLIRSLGLRPVPVAIDDDGMVPDGLSAALQQGVRAVLLVPRAQNPSGAAMSAKRAAEIQDVLAARPEPIVVEDDHAGPIAGAPHHTAITDRARWAVVRSVSKSLGPDLRVAALTGDEHTVNRLLGRQRLGTGWVSRILQALAAEVWDRAEADGAITRAARTYTQRRVALVESLADHGVACHGRSGLNVWVPIAEEAPVVQNLAARGWGVQAGEPYRLSSGPAIRITASRLTPDRASVFAADLASVLQHERPSRMG